MKLRHIILSTSGGFLEEELSVTVPCKVVWMKDFPVSTRLTRLTGAECGDAVSAVPCSWAIVAAPYGSYGAMVL